MTKMTVKFLKSLNTLVIKNEFGRGLFVSTSNSLIITIQELATLLRFLIFNGFLNVKVLEGLIEEYYTFRPDIYSDNS